MPNYKNTYGIVAIIFLVSIDQLSKYIIRTQGGFYICNGGLAFGLPLISTISLLFCFSIILFLLNLKFRILNLKSISNFKFKISNYSQTALIGIILIISGAISNIIDRLYFGCVFDFIDLKFWPVFNIADVYITIGGMMLLFALIRKK